MSESKKKRPGDFSNSELDHELETHLQKALEIAVSQNKKMTVYFLQMALQESQST